MEPAFIANPRGQSNRTDDCGRSTYARAYSGLADSVLLIANLRSRKEANDKAKAAARRAVELDETMAEAHTSLGLIAMNCDWDWPASEKEYKRALELNPNYPTAHHWYAEYLNAVGRTDQALAEIDRARELDPLSVIINSDKAKLLYYARRYDEAIDQLRHAVEKGVLQHASVGVDVMQKHIQRLNALL